MDVIWAVDAFEQSSAVRENVIRALRGLQRRAGAAIRPVYVLSPAELSLSLEFTPPWIDHYQPAAESALRSALAGLTGLDLQPSEVLVQSSPSRKSAAVQLSRYAETHGADVIVMGTHARSGITRLLLGSFAETLTLHARVPTLVVGPQALGETGFRKVLFPTDLGDHSRNFFEYAVGLCSRFGAELILYHSLPNPAEPMLQSGVYLMGGGWVPLQTYFEEDRAGRERKAEAMIHWAARQGVRATSFLRDRGGGVAEDIVGYASGAGVDLVVMGAQSGPVALALIGSVTRKVLRHATCPVWVLHPRRRREEKKAA